MPASPQSSPSDSNEALPSWSVQPVEAAGTVKAGGTTPAADPGARRTAAASVPTGATPTDADGPSRGLLLGGGALTAAIVVLAAVAMLTGSGEQSADSSPMITAPETPAVEEDDAADPDTSPDEAGDVGDDASDTDDSDSVEAAPTDPLAFTEANPDQESVDGPVSLAELAQTSDRRAVVSGGVVYLSGSVPSRMIADAIVAKAAAVMGSENVVDQYEIDPAVPFDPTESAPLYVEDLVLFPTGSAEVSPEFQPLLDLGVVLMSQNPNVTIDVIGHTDSIGSAEGNLALSQARVDAVVAYWVEAGIDPERIRAFGLGESQPIADNTTPDGKQINRRVEFTITGLLDD